MDHRSEMLRPASPSRPKGALALPPRLTIDTLIDVGVASGTGWLYDRFPDARLVLVDPLGEPAGYEELAASRRCEVHACAAGSEAAVARFNVDPDRPSRSSLYDRTALTRRAVKLERSATRIERLDILAGDPALGRLGLKIDTEGHELEVLKGAAGILQRCAFVLCEVSIAERFEGSYRFAELIGWMAAAGFHVSDIMRVARTPDGAPLFADILFEPASPQA